MARNKLSLLLNTLPDTADDIAVFLEGQGIKGRRGNAEQCAIARYLVANGFTDVDVCSDECDAAIGGKGYRTKPPRRVAEFIALFDAAKYPRLLDYRILDEDQLP